MKKVTDEMFQRIKKLDRRAIIRACSSLEDVIWPEELGPEPKRWRNTKKQRSTAWPIRYAVMRELLHELGRREYDQVRSDSRGYTRKRIEL